MSKGSRGASLAFLVAVAAFLFWPRASRAATLPATTSQGSFGVDVLFPTGEPSDGLFPALDLIGPGYGYDWAPWSGDTAATAAPSLGYDWMPWSDPATADWIPDMSRTDAYLPAFLYAIRLSEHLRADVESGNDYFTTYGGGRIRNLSDHPAITGEWKGKRLTDAQCRAAGFRPGCVSTAAGAYQIIRPTWERVRKAGTWGPRLPDFTKASQDEAARRILIECGALPFIEMGDLQNALARAASQWASLPGNTAGQPQKTIAQFVGFFNEGLFAA